MLPGSRLPLAAAPGPGKPQTIKQERARARGGEEGSRDERDRVGFA